VTVASAHTSYAVIHDTTAIPGITAVNLTSGGRAVAPVTGGMIYSRFAHIAGQDPGLQFDTAAAQEALDLCALVGTDIGTLGAGLSIFAQKIAEGGLRAGATSHKKMVINEGTLYLARLRCDHQGNLTATYQAVLTYDGSNDPIVLTEGQSLPTDPTDVIRHTIGQTTVGAIALTGIGSIEIDTGIRPIALGSDSDHWPTFSGLAQIAPRIIVRGNSVDWWKDSGGIGLSGAAATHANTIIYFRKRTKVGFVADVTAEHIKISAAGVAQLTDLWNVAGSDPGQLALEVVCDYDGTNAPILINTASAIT
jgi:hypothetical protein